MTAESLTSEVLLNLADEIASGASPAGLIHSRAAKLIEQIEGDAAASRFDVWGASTALEENRDAPVIPRSLFEYLHAVAGIPAQWPIGNAGVVHVYGYLLSAVRTPHGLKNERWLGGRLASALGLPADHFAPASRANSTLLQRVSAAAAPLLHTPGDATGLWFWAEEIGDHPGADGESRAVLARTVVVRGAGSDDGALVYGVGTAGPGELVAPSLVTSFPIAGLTSSWAHAFAATSPRLRFNAAADGVPPRTPLDAMQVLVRP